MPPDPLRIIVPSARPIKLICDVTRLWRNFAPPRKFSAYATVDWYYVLKARTRGVTIGGKGAQFPGYQNTTGRRITTWVLNPICWARRKVSTVSQPTFFKTVNLLLENLRLEYGGAKLASCPGRHPWVAEPFSKCGHKWSSKIYRKFLWFELATMTPQALKYDGINFCQHVLCNVL